MMIGDMSLDELKKEISLREQLVREASNDGKTYILKNEELKKNPRYALCADQLNSLEKKLNKNTVKGYKRKRAARTAIVTAVIIVILFMGLMSVEAFRTFTIDLLIGIDKSYGSIQPYSKGMFVASPGIYVPGYIPEDYRIASFQTSAENNTIKYTDSNGNMIIFFQQSAINGGGIVDTEESQIEEVKINKQDGKLIVKNDGSNILIWQTEETYFSIVSSNLSKKDLIKIAESVVS